MLPRRRSYTLFPYTTLFRSRAIRLTPPDQPIDLILHTPGGLVLAAEQIAKALVERKARSEEHTSELQSRLHLVCGLLLEKKTVRSIGTSSDTGRLAGVRHQH